MVLLVALDAVEELEVVGDAVEEVVDAAPLSVGVGRTTVTDIGGAGVTEMDVGAAPVP